MDDRRTVGRNALASIVMQPVGGRVCVAGARNAVNLRTLVVLAALASPAFAGLATAQQAPGDARLHVRIETTSVAAVRSALEDAGYDVLGTDAGASTIDLAVSGAERDALTAGGYPVTLVDRSRPLREALRSTASARITAESPAPGLVPATYRDLDGVLARMREIETAYPAIAQFVDLTAALGTPVTFEGRHLYALKISDHVTIDEDEPAVLIVGGHHAREIVTPVLSLGAAERLTAGYQTDPRIAAAVDAHEIWIAPVWNPDGYNHVFTTDNLWRKNRRVFANGVGVDQNRNYPQGWGAACSGSTSAGSETYKGPAPASEAETQTMMVWARGERFAKVVDYHSSGREVLYAYRCSSHPFSSWMQQQAAAISGASGYGGATRLPSAEGEHQQWQFAQMGAYAFLVETHTVFQPEYESAVAEAALVWPGILSAIERPTSISGHVTDAATGLPLSAGIEMLNVTFANGEANSSGGPHGAYHVFLPPGTYDIRFLAAGYTPFDSRLTVTASSSATVDVQLSRGAPAPPAGVRIVR